MSLLPVAFLMGFFGSLHCAVMCGPIVLGLPLKQQNPWYTSAQIVLYQLGRTATYTILGLVIGYIGNSFTFFARQETLSLIIGIILVSFTILQLSGKKISYVDQFYAKLLSPISKLMGKVFNLPFWGFLAGMLNGLIPCGMVYLALATALNLASVKDGAKFMFLFGLGTSPLMLFISFGGIHLKKYFRFNTQKLIPWFMLFMGTLFILRSANLGIPFISPTIHSTYGGVEICE